MAYTDNANQHAKVIISMKITYLCSLIICIEHFLIICIMSVYVKHICMKYLCSIHSTKMSTKPWLYLYFQQYQFYYFGHYVSNFNLYTHFYCQLNMKTQSKNIVPFSQHFLCQFCIILHEEMGKKSNIWHMVMLVMLVSNKVVFS